MFYIRFCVVICLILASNSFSQSPLKLSNSEIISVSNDFLSKVGSGDLLRKVNEKQSLLKKRLVGPNEAFEDVIVYCKNIPTETEIIGWEKKGLTVFKDSWTSPVNEHPLGYLLGRMNVTKFSDVLNISEIIRIETGSSENKTLNNKTTKLIKADSVWFKGYKGTGVKVAVLDAGLDYLPVNADLPVSFEKKDYSNYPSLDDNVENSGKGHGIHVVGTLLGRGVLSNNNTGNEGGSYAGVAPDADLVFLKIGKDNTGVATTNAMISAINAAVTVYNAKIISMSYGTWDIYHDGSDARDQKVDWAFQNGVPFFIAAGNEGNTKRHFSGMVSAKDSSELIKVNVIGAYGYSTFLYFNMVWADAGLKNNLTLKYYTSNGNEITNVYHYPTTTSIRGTESQISTLMDDIPDGNSVYFVRVINNSNAQQQYHIYEHFNDGKVTFDSPDPGYTLVSPATSTYGFTVGSFTGRTSWTAADGVTYSISDETINDVSSFSSRGPRIDGLIKPDLLAPGTSIISLRDRDSYTNQNYLWVSNSGSVSTDANYYVMTGTSMAAPVCAGAAALLLSKYPKTSPIDLYSALRNNTSKDSFTSNLPNGTHGYGKLNINSAIDDPSLKWINPYNPDTIHITKSINISDSGCYIGTPFPGMGTGQKYGEDDWNYSEPQMEFFILPTGSQSFNAAQFYIEWDSTMASLVNCEVGNYFDNPLFQSLKINNGKLLINISGLDGNSLPDVGKYLTKIKFKIFKPGENNIIVSSVDLRYYDSNLAGFKDVYSVSLPAKIKFLLGDFSSSDSILSPGNGVINYSDLAKFSLAYWGTTDSLLYRAKYDVGPTEDGYFSMPMPDGKIDFEDLSIFASGYFYSASGIVEKSTAGSYYVELTKCNTLTVNNESEYLLSIKGDISKIKTAKIILSNTASLKPINIIADENYVLLFKDYDNKSEINLLALTDNSKSREEIIIKMKLSYSNSATTNEPVISECIIRDGYNKNLEVKSSIENSVSPEKFDLKQNYPNPFNPLTTIEYSVKQKSLVELKVYDMLGRVVAVPVNSVYEPGNYKILFIVNDLASGIYFYQIVFKNEFGNTEITKKMVVLK